jgi:hypothetical protein
MDNRNGKLKNNDGTARARRRGRKEKKQCKTGTGKLKTFFKEWSFRNGRMGVLKQDKE